MSDENENELNETTQTSQTSPFDAIRHEDEQGEYWSARELGEILGYTKWQNFSQVITRAQIACETSGYAVSDHFTDVGKLIESGKGARRRIQDFKLSRYACYLVVQNGDPEKEVVAMGQTYFAVQTREQEIQGAQNADIAAVIARAKARVDTRSKLSESYDALEATAANQGMRGQRNFAQLHHHGDLGMYTMSKGALAERHNLHPQRGQRRVNVNDHEGVLEMGATIMRNGIADADIGQMQRPTNGQMFQANFEAGAEIRSVLMGHGIVPEDLPKEPHISEARKIADGQIPLSLTPRELLPDPQEPEPDDDSSDEG